MKASLQHYKDLKNLDLNIFPSVDKAYWLQLAEKQLKGANPIEELAWKNDADILLEGYYDSKDITGLDYLEDFFSSIKPHQWKLYESIDCSVPQHANKSALDALMGGCDGVILDKPDKKDLSTILKDINLDICDINIIASTDLEGTPPIKGFLLNPGGTCVSSLEKKNPINQLVDLLQKLTNQTHIYREAHSDFFLEIATVRALRYLLENKGFENVHIHSHVSLHDLDDHQWFLNTTAGLASILGGSHSIDLSTATGDSRISRNTGNLIREESGIENYSDQCGGSFYIEVLTDKIIKQVTEKLK